MAGMRLRDIGCPFNALNTDVAKSLSAFGELRRFLKPLAVRVATRVTEVEITHRPRPGTGPQSSYSANRLVRLFMDFFVNSLGDVFAWVFLLSAGLSGLLVLVALGWFGAVAAGSASPAGALVVLGLAIEAALVALLGLGGDYVQRIYRQSTGRPFYLVRRVQQQAAATTELADAG
jgi:hypothetical protein